MFEEVSCYSYHIILQPYCMTNFKSDEAAAPGEIRYKAYIWGPRREKDVQRQL